MMATKILHTSYTEKNGYVFRKRMSKNAITISLQTREPEEAEQRAAHMALRYLELEKVGLPFDAMRTTLKAYRDDLVRNRKISALSAIVSSAILSPTTPAPVQEIAAQIELNALENENHTLESVKQEWANEIGRNWRPGTRAANMVKIDKFIAWAAVQGITAIEQINKSHISAYKDYLDETVNAVSTRNLFLTQVGSLFKFCSVQRDYLTKSPVEGLSYKNVKSATKKYPVTESEYEAIKLSEGYRSDNQIRWTIEVLHNTGMRIAEWQQITKADYVEVEGVKCFSINAENGKAVKNENAVRNIPISERLLAIGIWETKPTIRITSKDLSNRVARVFKGFGMKRTAHSFRVGLSDRLREAGIQDSTRNFILGHAATTMSDSVYISRKPLEQMQNAINEVNRA